MRDRETNLYNYVHKFDSVINTAVEQFRADYGELTATIKIVTSSTVTQTQIGWKELARLTTAVGSQTLAIRGSDKSIYGKLFEKLILGSTLTILGYQRQDPHNLRSTNKVFWLSDSSSTRESDATLLYRSGKMAKFDIGFIGRGNPEISKDKLSRYEREIEAGGSTHEAITFIIVDTLPAKSKKTQDAAKRIGAEIIQMNWQYWPQRLAQRLGDRLGFTHELATLPEKQVREYLTTKISSIAVQDFLSAVSVTDIEEAAEAEGEEMLTDFNEDE